MRLFFIALPNRSPFVQYCHSCKKLKGVALSLFLCISSELIFCVCVAGQVLAQERIVGGYVPVPHSIKYIVSIQTTDRQHFCGGFLINKFWVITAAHCNIGWAGFTPLILFLEKQKLHCPWSILFTFTVKPFLCKDLKTFNIFRTEKKEHETDMDTQWSTAIWPQNYKKGPVTKHSLNTLKAEKKSSFHTMVCVFFRL